MDEPVNKAADRLLQVELVADVIIKLCAVQEQRQVGVPETWPSTRDISESCNFSIYKTRYLLLKMVRKGWVQVTPRPVNNALRWFICPSMPGKGQQHDQE